MAECIVPGCAIDARNTLSVRIRWPDTHAAWVRETGAHVCDQHATEGARLTIIFEPADTQQIELRTYGTAAVTERRTPTPERDTDDSEETEDDQMTL